MAPELNEANIECAAQAVLQYLRCEDLDHRAMAAALLRAAYLLILEKPGQSDAKPFTVVP